MILKLKKYLKVIEEAPSPFLDPETRAAMGEQAVQLAKAIGGAGREGWSRSGDSSVSSF